MNRERWRDLPGEGNIPQIILVKRTVNVHGRGLAVSEDSLLGRLVGMDGMSKWLDRSGTL